MNKPVADGRGWSGIMFRGFADGGDSFCTQFLAQKRNGTYFYSAIRISKKEARSLDREALVVFVGEKISAALTKLNSYIDCDCTLRTVCADHKLLRRGEPQWDADV